LRELARRYRKAKPELYNAISANYRAKRLQRIPAWADLEAIRKFYGARPEGYHVDHIIPLNGKDVSGLHVLNNLQYLPAEENIKKNNKFNILEDSCVADGTTQTNTRYIGK
jgi:hypothetical protein